MQKLIMRKVFIGIGAYTGNGVLTGSDNLSVIVGQFIDLAALKNINTIGVYHGELGIYLEESKMVNFEGQTFKSLSKEYPNEEAFYVAKLTGFTRIGGDIKEILADRASKLPLEGGFTITRSEVGEAWHLVTTTKGELLCK